MSESAVPDFPATKVKAGWATYRLSEMRTDRSVRDETFAVVDHSAHTIEVSVCHGYASAAKSLLHELLHIVERVWVVQDGDSEERRVATASHGLATLWRDNQGLMMWIHRGLTGGHDEDLNF